jgi:hypothetical protein
VSFLNPVDSPRTQKAHRIITFSDCAEEVLRSSKKAGAGGDHLKKAIATGVDGGVRSCYLERNQSKRALSEGIEGGFFLRSHLAALLLGTATLVSL